MVLSLLCARRLVGRGLQGGRRMDASDGAHLRRPALPGRTRRRDDLQHHRGADRPEILRPRHGRHPARVGFVGEEVRGGHRLELHDQPHADRLREPVLRQARRAQTRDERRGLPHGPRDRGLEAQGLRRMGPGAHRRRAAREDRQGGRLRRREPTGTSWTHCTPRSSRT